jgi:uncharacterized membrane protein YkoI
MRKTRLFTVVIFAAALGSMAISTRAARIDSGDATDVKSQQDELLTQDESLKLLKFGTAAADNSQVVAVAVAAEKDEDDDKDEDEGEKIKFADAPAAVQKTMLRESGGVAIKEVLKETEDGKTTYEAEVKIDGHEYVIKVGADGVLLEKSLEDEDDEVPIKFADAPAPVQKTLLREAGAVKIDKVDKLEREGRTLYEADVKIDGKNYEVVITAEGLLLSKELDEEGEEEDK